MNKKQRILLAAAAILLIFLAVLLWPKANSAPADSPFLIGQLLYRTSNPDTLTFSVARKAVVEAAGGQLVTAEMSDTPESMIGGVEDLLKLGCRGIILTPVSNAVLPQIMKLCDDAQVYWIVSMRPIHDAGLFETLSASPYFLGVVSEDDASAADQIVRQLADQGVKTAATYSISNFNTAIEARELGIKQACTQYGIEILEELVNIKEDDMLQQSLDELLALHPDLDAIISLSNSAIGHGLPILETISKSGAPLKFASFDTGSSWGPYYDQGIVQVAANCHSTMDAVLATSLLVHAVQGTPISGQSLQVTLPYSLVMTSEQLAQVKELDTVTFLDRERIAALLDPDADWAAFEAYKTFCIEQLRE